jgi:hypothetical protein
MTDFLDSEVKKKKYVSLHFISLVKNIYIYKYIYRVHESEQLNDEMKKNNIYSRNNLKALLLYVMYTFM